ncbi:MAG: class I SAM-dependent methyltransferase [Luteolibacter sp.]
MPDSSQSPRPEGRRHPQAYPIGNDAAIPSLKEEIFRQIDAHGPLDFAAFMELALYEPSLGYYARETRQIGRQGDFFTSVSTGPLFGELLARRFLQHWHEIGEPPRWRIIESGAHDGTLAFDILNAIHAISPTASTALEYAIAEPLDQLRAAQVAKLSNFENIRHIRNPIELVEDRLPGIAFGNEVLDALPFHLVERHESSWLECHVDRDGDSLTWARKAIKNPALTAELSLLGEHFADGHRTEIRLNFNDFLKPLHAALDDALMIWIDYGFAATDLHHPLRKAGTLRTFSHHRAGDDPLTDPGDKDITAHVDFTAVAKAAMKLGGKPIEFHNQGAWLTELARDWITRRDGSPNASEIRQFQTLTHPAQLGGKFQVLEISWASNAVPKDPASLARRLFPTD